MPRLIAFLTSAVVLGLLFSLALGSDEKPSSGLIGKSINDLAWISGSWFGEHDGGIVEENWSQPSGGTMAATGRLVIDGKTVFHEYLRLVQNADGSIDYIALPFGKGAPVPFRMTRLDGEKAVFENPAHDDPKLVRYELRADGALFAATEGPGKDGKWFVHEYQMRPVKPKS